MYVVYLNKYTLKTHQKSKSCLKNKVQEVQFIVYQCSICEKDMTTKFNLKIHESTCSLRKKIIVDTFESMSAENIILKKK